MERLKVYNPLGKVLKALMYILLVLVTAFLIVPIVFSILGSFSAYWGKTMFSKGLTLEWYEYVFYYYGHTIGITLLITISTVIINIMVRQYIRRMNLSMHWMVLTVLWVI